MNIIFSIYLEVLNLLFFVLFYYRSVAKNTIACILYTISRSAHVLDTELRITIVYCNNSQRDCTGSFFVFCIFVFIVVDIFLNSGLINV